MNAGAKISATDNAGDNALHIALRARSKRITQCLLKNPSDSRLLYRPNKSGQTPYSIDQESSQPIIPLIFGPLDAEVQMDAMLGYDVYSNVLADIACEPSLVLPLTIGMSVLASFIDSRGKVYEVFQYGISGSAFAPHLNPGVGCWLQK